MEISAHTCRGDKFCRCFTCKPRCSQSRAPSNRVVIGSTGLALVILALMAHL